VQTSATDLPSVAREILLGVYRMVGEMTVLDDPIDVGELVVVSANKQGLETEGLETEGQVDPAVTLALSYLDQAALARLTDKASAGDWLLSGQFDRLHRAVLAEYGRNGLIDVLALAVGQANLGALRATQLTLVLA
jgi:hypothetical protein